MTRIGKTFNLSQAATKGDFAAAADLFHEYQNWLNEPVCFKGFHAELDALDSIYIAPSGVLFLACLGLSPDPIGVVGARYLERDNCVELKRLYVREPGRGHGIGRALVQAVVDWAWSIDVESIHLKTFNKLDAARAIYRDLGFIAAHCSDGSRQPVTMSLTRT